MTAHAERDAKIVEMRKTMGPTEIARRLNTTVGTVTGALFRARKPEYARNWRRSQQRAWDDFKAGMECQTRA